MPERGEKKKLSGQFKTLPSGQSVSLVQKKERKTSQWSPLYRRKTFPMTVCLPCTEGKKKKNPKNKLLSGQSAFLVPKEKTSVDSLSPLYRRKKPQWTVCHPCTEGRNLSGQSVTLVPKEETFSVDSPSPLYGRKEEKEGKNKTKLPIGHLYGRKTSRVRNNKSSSVDSSNLSQWTVCLPYTEEKRTLLRGQLKPVPCGQSVSLIVVRGKKLPPQKKKIKKISG